MLDVLGMSPVADALYRAMIAAPDADVADLAVVVGLDEDVVRAGLDELAAASLVRAEDEHLRVVSPDVGIPALLAREQVEIARRAQAIEESRLALAELVTSQGSVQVGADVVVLDDAAQARDCERELLEHAQHDVRVLAAGPGLTGRAIRDRVEQERELVDRSVRVRVVYLESVRNDTECWEAALDERDHGIEVRVSPTLPVPLLVVDGTDAVVPVHGQTSMRLSSSGAVGAMGVLFDQVWRAARPLGLRRTRDGDGLNARERELLRLWAGGATDESAGETLGVSVRTIRRLSATLMERLGSASRFQAGAQAVARGWLDAADLV